MNSELYYLISTSKNKDTNSLLLLINKFDPLVKKYAAMLNYDDSYSDLIIYFISAIYKIPIDKPCFKQDKYILSYINKTIKNAYLYYSIKKSYILNHETVINDEICCNCDVTYNDVDNKIYLLSLLSYLTEKEKQIIFLKYYKCYSDIEISNKFKISRQAVNKTKNIALNKLKNIILNS